ncbi:SEC-C domain-containing protein [[Mycobacterium] vasticus]|uniref:SEC-C domain-containing protein n=1 Tax=[Mycobacterium] vasticus TaxID=2875777 RepID=A0ABU5Z1E7_9MYCO|nr:SEC-C domain-containing protein [Mycolicibacter sp. MYC017]MEB3070039.1 SEC-C domain-containing protein [Mycolicibacter sp. MYC017]
MTEHSDLIELLSAILAGHGPLAEDDIDEFLREAGVADPARALRRLRLRIDLPAGQLVDGRWAWLPSLLAGRVFTHRVTEPEVGFDVLTVSPDLAPIAALCASATYQRLADGSAVHLVTPGDEQLLSQLDIPEWLFNHGDVLAFAVGTFERLGVDNGNLVGLRLGDAGLVVERVTTTAQTTVGAELAVLLDAQPERVEALVWTACLASPTLCTEPAAPLSELVAEQGLARHGNWLAPTDFNFRVWAFGRECDRLARHHRLTDDAAVALNTLLRLYGLLMLHDLRQSLPSADGVEPAVVDIGDTMDDVGNALADPAIAEALASETIPDGRLSAGGLRALANALEPRVASSARVACQWLRAVACERDGDMAGFERALLEAQAMDGDWPLPLFDLAEIASYRGDAEAGLALLRRARAKADHPLVYLLRLHHCPPPADLGRNAPCWCGSGRKYKKCHLGGLPLRDRVGWLYHKALAHVLLGNWTDLRYAVALKRCGSVIDDGVAEFNAALADPVVIDTVLFEGGGFDEFLTVRGTLLPDDELQLAEQWLRTPRSVFEVEQVQHGGSTVVRDAGTGERHEVDGSDYPLQAGQLVCARLASDGVGLRFFALEPVSAQQRDPLIKLLARYPDPLEFVALLSDGADTSSPVRAVAHHSL